MAEEAATKAAEADLIHPSLHGDEIGEALRLGMDLRPQTLRKYALKLSISQILKTHALGSSEEIGEVEGLIDWRQVLIIEIGIRELLQDLQLLAQPALERI